MNHLVALALRGQQPNQTRRPCSSGSAQAVRVLLPEHETGLQTYGCVDLKSAQAAFCRDCEKASTDRAGLRMADLMVNEWAVSRHGYRED